MYATPIPVWMAGLTRYVRADQPDLTNRQLAVLMQVAILPGPHTVRGLAKELNVSKPVITRALDKLSDLGLLRRQPDETDGRNVLVVATAEGTAFLGKFDTYFKDPVAGTEQGRDESVACAP